MEQHLKSCVLWIDDQFRDQYNFITLLAQQGIDIDAFDNVKEGIAHLKLHLYKYDAIMIDAKVHKDNAKSTLTLGAMNAAIAEIKALEQQRKIPYFIYTGQPDLLSSDELREMLDGTKVFSKNQNWETLIQYIHGISKHRDEHNIEHLYANVLQVFSDNYLGEAGRKELIDILVKIEKNDFNLDADLYMNSIRKIIEQMMSSYRKFNVLPPACENQHGGINITYARKYLAGEEIRIQTSTSYKIIQARKPIHDTIIKSSLEIILQVTNERSHYNVYTQHTYLLPSITFALFNVLLYYKKYLDDHLNKEINKLNWTERIVPL